MLNRFARITSPPHHVLIDPASSFADPSQNTIVGDGFGSDACILLAIDDSIWSRRISKTVLPNSN
jgi:hypothetical protein